MQYCKRQAKLQNFTVLRHILLQQVVQKLQREGGSIHFLKALFMTSSETNVSRLWMWGT